MQTMKKEMYSPRRERGREREEREERERASAEKRGETNKEKYAKNSRPDKDD